MAGDDATRREEAVETNALELARRAREWTDGHSDGSHAERDGRGHPKHSEACLDTTWKAGFFAATADRDAELARARREGFERALVLVQSATKVMCYRDDTYGCICTRNAIGRVREAARPDAQDATAEARREGFERALALVEADADRVLSDWQRLYDDDVFPRPPREYPQAERAHIRESVERVRQAAQDATP